MMKKLLTLIAFFTGICVFSQSYVVPVYAVTSLQPAQPGNATSNTIDNDINTFYHSKWGQNGIPDELHFYFTQQVSSINKIVYTPRQSGTNGIWTKVSVYYSTQSDPTNFILISADLSWTSDNQDKTINLATAIQNPYAIKFVVNQGNGKFSSCAEMKFYSDIPVAATDNGVDCTIATTALSASGANDIKATIIAAGSNASSYQSGEDINNSFDNDVNTLYHSSYSATAFPVILNYQLNGTTAIDYLKYIPRKDGGTNGNFGNVTISYNTTTNSTFQNLMTFNLGQSGLPGIIKFPSQITPLNIQISLQDGVGGFASCAEMEFYTAGAESSSTPYMDIFANDIYSALLPNITQANIDAISEPFYKDLAQCLFNKTYVTKYRIQSYEVYPTLTSVSQNLKIGTYDNFENSTGIVFAQGEKIALFAKNIPANATVYLTIKDFQAGWDGAVSNYVLQNGLNVFQLTNGGMAYIPYFNNNSALNDVEINIVSGKINGYFDSETSSNNEWADLLAKTAYPYIDIRGKYVHLVYEKASLRNGCPLDGQKLIGQYDTVVQHERMLMGLFKYNKSLKNHILTYNEHGGGYNAGGLGVHLDIDWGPAKLTDPNQLDFWGIAHEYGHVNQTRPDLKWIGTTEVTNNIHTVWVDYNMNHANHSYTRLEEENIVPAPGVSTIAGGRINGAIYNTIVNSEALQGNTNYDEFKVLVPFWQLEIYYQLAGASRNAPILSFNYPSNYTGTDYAHWYGIVSEVSRTTNSAGLTNGELLLNFVKNTCDAVKEDLTLFFQKTGFLKPIDISIFDYVTGQLTVTQEQIDETIAYIKSKNYQQPVSPVIHYASAHSINMFKNQLPLSGITGAGVVLNDNYLTVQHSDWHNAVAYETYDAGNKLIYVSVSGTGDLSNQTTKVYYPTNAREVYAVGFNGQRILVYPANILSVNETSMNSKLMVYPNPVSDARRIHLTIENASGNYAVQIFGLDGRSLFTSKGTIETIEYAINQRLVNLQSGMYILTLENASKEQYQVKLIKE